MISVLESLYVVNYAYWFMHAKPPLYSWIEADLIIVSDIWDILVVWMRNGPHREWLY